MTLPFAGWNFTPVNSTTTLEARSVGVSVSAISIRPLPLPPLLQPASGRLARERISSIGADLFMAAIPGAACEPAIGSLAQPCMTRLPGWIFHNLLQADK